METTLITLAGIRIQKIRWVGLFACLPILFLTGCAGGLPQILQQSLSVVAPHQVDFVELEHYAKRSYAAYGSKTTILRQFPQTTRVTIIKSIDVLYFVETDRKRKHQTISIRGTASKPNIWQDVELAMVKDRILGINLHRGFRNDARQVYKDLKRYISKDYATRVTGHSLGGAIAMIIAGYLTTEGYNVERIVTFGQPKISNETDETGFGRGITRVAHDEDVVPMLPPGGFQRYVHIGPELVLRAGPNYVYLPSHAADRLSIKEFWRNLKNFSAKEHHMDFYLDNIQEKIEGGSRQVPYFGSPWSVARTSTQDTELAGTAAHQNLSE